MASDRPRILLFGAGGQVGAELVRALEGFGEVTALGRAEVDFAAAGDDAASLLDIVRSRRPDVVINAAAYTAVDRAESEPEQAHAVNAAAPAALARAADEVGACMVHYSTDYVFDGSKHGAYREDDATAPLSVYGRTKLEGEQAVATSCARHITLRTSWVYSARGTNFVLTMLRLAAERDALNVVADQRGTPTAAALLADATVRALRQLAAAPRSDARWGLYHVTAAGETTWHGFARHIIERAQSLGMPLRATPDAVRAITTAEYPTPARRPANSRLDTSRFRAVFGGEFDHWTSGVDHVLDQLMTATTSTR